jgi:hypothetical protein
MISAMLTNEGFRSTTHNQRVMIQGRNTRLGSLLAHYNARTVDKQGDLESTESCQSASNARLSMRAEGSVS